MSVYDGSNPTLKGLKDVAVIRFGATDVSHYMHVVSEQHWMEKTGQHLPGDAVYQKVTPNPQRGVSFW